jgi:type IX secretion system PorP/SprF family membrane protein
MRFLFNILLISCLSIQSHGQHFPVFSQYMLNGLAINPAYAGSRDVLSASLMYRNQWIGFDGAPVTASLSAHMPMRNKTVALGLYFMNEKIGFINNVSCFGQYAYRVRVGKGRLAFGLKAGFEMLKEDQSKIVIQQSDAVFNNENKGYFLPNFGFGTYYYNSKFFLGAAVPAFMSYREASKGNGFEPYNDVKNYNFLISTGILIRVNDYFKIKPSTLLRYLANSPIQYDLNCNAILFKEEVLWLGASYRAGDAIVGLVEYQFNPQIRIGYAYDYSLGPLSKYNSGSHEIMFRYEFKYKINATNPRYF